MTDNTTTTVEKITSVLHPIWIYYRREISHLIVPQCIQDNLAKGNAQRMLDAFPHLTRAEAGFLALVMYIILGEAPFEYKNDEPEDICEEEAPKWLIELIQSHAEISLRRWRPRPGFREELWGRMLDMIDETDSIISGEDDGQ